MSRRSEKIKSENLCKNEGEAEDLQFTPLYRDEAFGAQQSTCISVTEGKKRRQLAERGGGEFCVIRRTIKAL